MDDYLSRLGMTKVPGICGYAFQKGEILGDQEAVRETERLATDIRRLCNG